MIEPAGPGRARRAGSADPLPQPAVEPAAVPSSGNSLVSLLAIVLVAALVGGAVSAGVTLAMLASKARTNPQELNLRSGVTVNEESNTVQLVSTAQPAVVSVVTKVGSGGTTSGSGFVVTSDGNIVTNIRVIANAQMLSVLIAGDSKPHDARIVDFDCETGLAALKIDKVSNLRTLSFGDANALKLGQSVVAMGGPLQGSARRGIVSGLHRTSSVDDAVNPARTDHLSDTIETDAAIDDAHPLPQVLRAQFKPSQRVTMTIWRAGSTRQLELTLGSQHPTCQ